MSSSGGSGSGSVYEIGECSNASIPQVQYRRGILPYRPSVNIQTQLPVYRDCGDCIHVCSSCFARFWFDERVASLSRVTSPLYTQCCKLGKVALPYPFRPPQQLITLFQNKDFMENIRAYNSMFGMTSFGAKIDNTVNMGRGPYTFKISGQISHWIGSLCPPAFEPPRFLQLYMYDTANEVSNRLRFYGGDAESLLSAEVVHFLSVLLNLCNGYVRTFKTASEIASVMNLNEYAVRLYAVVPDERYGPPMPGSLGGIVCGDDENASDFDIIVYSKAGEPHSVSKLHHSYMPLQYPLLFPYGENGWSCNMRLRDADGSRTRPLTVNMYYSYQLHDRAGFYSHLLHGGRLFQQYLVDAYVSIEQGRLDYIRRNQDNLRSEYVAGIYDAISKGDSESKVIGKRVFLPSSFVGGPRYMYQHYQDAMAICRVYGKPQYFVTFTCNVNWPEIVRYIAAVEVSGSQNRPDIIARVFHMKVLELITFVKQDKPFGDIVAYLYTIEFQKRGLPHCHSLFWVSASSAINVPSDVDKFITAELPNPNLEQSLYRTITSYMIHGPCGLLNPKCLCMRDGQCSKSYPKPFNVATSFDADGYVHYKRRDNASHVLKNGIEIHNGFVVPYNKRLCSRFNAHINVEYCGWNMMIKYLFKYISKGLDRVCFTIQKAEAVQLVSPSASIKSVDEIKDFVDGRFICPHEAAWRIFNFPIHQRMPAVQILSVHIEDMQSTTFPDNVELQSLVRNPAFGKTTLTGWFANNRMDASGRHLTYIDYPSEFRWDCRSKDWIRRQTKAAPSIGRLINVHPTAGEPFYLRLLLSHQKGCRCYTDLRTVNNRIYPTFQQACEALGIIGDDKEWMIAFNDAAVWASAYELRTLFCHLLLYCDVGNPLQLWENGWRKMSDDISYSLRSVSGIAASVIDARMLQQHVLLELERLLNSATPAKSLSDFQLPLPSTSLVSTLRNRLLIEETTYDRSDLQKQHAQMVLQLNADQLNVYNRVSDADSSNRQLLLFVYGHGGTGKTFLWSTILAYFRSMGKIVLAVAGSGIASLLLPAGRTAHSRFNIPLDLTDMSICNIRKRTQLADLIKQTCLVIWDEATMTDRKCFECVDRSFRDLLDKKDVPFGGMSVLLGGDFRQTLPVKPKGSSADVIASTLPNSYLWSHFTICRLHQNMRLSSSTESCSVFASWLLDIGNGALGIPIPNTSENTKSIDIPSYLLIENCSDPLTQLIHFVYDSEALNNPTALSLAERAIVCPKNNTADEINDFVLQLIDAPSKTYYSSDSIASHSQQFSDLNLLYTQDYLNQLIFPGFPLHKLNLKVRTPVILLRNINQRLGLCNGTRLIVTQLLSTVREAKIITGTSIGHRVYIPRIKFIHNKGDLPFVFVRKQYPLKVCYAMTINKSQGQSLKKVGIYLPQPVFSHGQLYVALSRATSAASIKMLILDAVGELSKTTNNVVFKDLLKQLNDDE